MFITATTEAFVLIYLSIWALHIVKYVWIKDFTYHLNQVIYMVNLKGVENEEDINKLYILQTIQQKTEDKAYQPMNSVST